MKTLIINAHPEYNFKESYTSIIQEIFINELKNKEIDTQIEVLNIYDEYIPELDANMLAIYRKKGKEELNEVETKIELRMKELLEQFKSAKRIVVVTPIFNYGIVGRLKDYMDNILIPRETFSYSSEGPVSLLNDGRKVITLQASGGIYNPNDKNSQLDYTNEYLESMFVDLMGFEQFNVIRAEGTSKSDYTKEIIIENFKNSLNEVLKNWY